MNATIHGSGRPPGRRPARVRLPSGVLALGFLVAGGPTASAAGMPPATAESLLVSAPWLRAHRSDADLVLLHISHRMDDQQRVELIPGSVELDYMAIAIHEGVVQTELPSADSLRALFRGAGISNDSRVVIYSADPIMAARAFVTLEAAGHRRVAVLNGGVAAWKALGERVVTEPQRPARPGDFEPAMAPDVVVDADWVKGHLGDPALALLDTRTHEEYEGAGDRHGMPSLGHLAGARLLLWQDLVAGPGSPYLKPMDELRKAYERAGAAPDRTVVTYCYVGYRASFSYFVARLLGYRARFYDGSYDDWSRRGYPVKKGVEP